jgi:hypothetical protein
LDLGLGDLEVDSVEEVPPAVPPTPGSELEEGVGEEAAVEGLTPDRPAQTSSLPDEEGFHPDRHAGHLLLAGITPYPADL